MLNFVALDFETANYHRSSACAIGITTMENGEITETFSMLIRPEPWEWVPEFISIHGIKPEDVEKCSKFDVAWTEISKRIIGKRLVAHNAPFDRSVLLACLKHFTIKTPQPEFVCTCRLARTYLPKLENHKLNTVCQELKIPLDHHQAASDSAACAKVLMHLHQLKDFSWRPGELSPTNWY